jgi:ParB family chromosome partitioning protein
VKEYSKNHPENAEAVIMAANCEKGAGEGYYSRGYGETMPYHVESRTLDVLYKHLCAIGYQMSDEEKALQNGTHELFREE